MAFNANDWWQFWGPFFRTSTLTDAQLQRADGIVGGHGGVTIIFDASDGPDTGLSGRGNDLIRVGGAAQSDLTFRLYFTAGDGNDTLIGGTGLDNLFGEGGHDVIRGGRQQDLISGGSGNDTMEGGMHADAFLYDWANRTGATYVGNTGFDVITDFDAVGRDGDKIVVNMEGIDSFADLTIRQRGTDVIVMADGGRQEFRHGGQTYDVHVKLWIRLEDVRLGDIDRGDFSF